MLNITLEDSKLVPTCAEL